MYCELSKQKSFSGPVTTKTFEKWATGQNLIKGHSVLCYRADLDTSFLTMKKSSPQPGIKVHPEMRSNFHRVLLHFQSFTVKPVFESPFTHPKILFLPYLIKSSIASPLYAMV